MHDRRFNPEHMAKLESPKRRAVLPPEPLLDKLEWNDKLTVLDLGAGTGYFALPAAKRTKENVYALDIEPKMLEVIKAKAEENRLANLITLKGQLEHIPLEDRTIASLVLHEAEPLEQALQEIFRVLRKDGQCLCLEWEKKQTDQGPPLHHRIESVEMKRRFQKTGFTVVTLEYPTDAHYVLIVQK